MIVIGAAGTLTTMTVVTFEGRVMALFNVYLECHIKLNLWRYEVVRSSVNFY